MEVSRSEEEDAISAENGRTEEEFGPDWREQTVGGQRKQTLLEAAHRPLAVVQQQAQHSGGNLQGISRISHFIQMYPIFLKASLKGYTF